MTNPYGCPDCIYEWMESDDRTKPDLLRAIKRLGPERVQYYPGKVPKGRKQESPVAWTLDGNLTNERDVMIAAGFPLRGIGEHACH